MKELLNGLRQQNPVFYLVLGMCPTLAVTTSVNNGLAMGLAVIFVLTCSSIIVSLIRNIVPQQIRIAVFVVIIATFVTMTDIFLKANYPLISKSLGPYVPLIVVNCIILGRAEAFASKNGLYKSFLDALGMGLGFTLALLILSSIREIFGSGTLLGYNLMGKGYYPLVSMLLPSGAFLVLGILFGIFNTIWKKK